MSRFKAGDYVLFALIALLKPLLLRHVHIMPHPQHAALELKTRNAP
jgi:hypothetical protein